MNIKLTTPFQPEDLANLKVGDNVLISGVIYTARDAAHKRIVELIESGKELPLELKDNAIYYTGPTPARPGEVIGSAGPTTSYRMDAYAPTLLDNGLKGMIGKGARSEDVIESIVRNEAVYFVAIGGAGALLSEAIISAEVIAWPELGPEAVRRLEVKDFPCIVAIDIKGNNIFKRGDR